MPLWMVWCALAGAQELQILADTTLGADEAWQSEDAWSGSLRLRFEGLTDPVVDKLGTDTARSTWATSRLRAGLAGELGSLDAALELEALSARWAGGTELGLAYRPDVFAVRRDGGLGPLAIVTPRQAWIGQQHTTALWRVGAQTFTWGTGMLANDGAGDPVFGDAVRGSVVARALGALTPWRGDMENGALMGVAFLGGVDFVLRDDNADLYAGDIAAQAVWGIRSDFPRWRIGLLGVARYQRDRLDPYHPLEHPETLAFPMDAYARVQLTDPNADQTLGFETEAVMIRGRTERSWTDENVAEGSRISSAAMVSRLRYDHNLARVTGVLEFGGASGDNDLRDDVVRTFQMHSDHNVGIILFEELLPMLSARAIDRAANPDISGVPSAGGRFAVSQGQVSNALYIYPTAKWRVADPVEFRLGWMQAWSAGDVIDVYESAKNGGYNQAYGGVTQDGRALGQEILVGSRLILPLRATRLNLGAESALFLPGSALSGLDLGPLVTARAKVDWTW